MILMSASSSSDELLFRKDVTHACSYRNPRSIRAQWSAQSRNNIALITNVNGRCINGVGGCSITRSPYRQMAGNRRLTSPGRTGDSNRPSCAACSSLRIGAARTFASAPTDLRAEPGAGRPPGFVLVTGFDA